MCQSKRYNLKCFEIIELFSHFYLESRSQKEHKMVDFSYSLDIMTSGLVLHFFQLQPNSCLLYHQEPPASAQQPVSACQRERRGAGWHRISRCGRGGEPHYKIIKAIMNFACKWIYVYLWLVSKNVWCHLEPTLVRFGWICFISIFHLI